MPFDIIIVGAGPGGSSAAAFLARQGLSVLLLDKAVFPRDKVCGDCLAPQALYWLDKLGCVDKVLDQTDACITSGDVFLNGAYLLTGDFPQDTQYPGFCTLLDRKRLDYILVQNAVKNGAVFKPGCVVKDIRRDKDYVVAHAESDGTKVRFKGKLVIGADGANSVVSRSIGNVLRDGTTAVSVRAYFHGVNTDRSQLQIYFDERFFPGYGWVFVDDSGKANVGLGYAHDKNFPMKDNLRKVFDEFVKRDLRKCLKGAMQVGSTAGWWASFFRPQKMVTDRIMLIGDAANLADPLNGGGIHKAMESAYMASLIAAWSVASGDFSADALLEYERLWTQSAGFDWRVGECLLSIGKNPNMRELYLFLLKYIARLADGNECFQNFCSGVFSGVIPAGEAVSPATLLNAAPIDPEAWFLMLTDTGESGNLITTDAALAGLSVLKTAGRMALNPLANLNWGAEVINKTFDAAGQYAGVTAFGRGMLPF